MIFIAFRPSRNLKVNPIISARYWATISNFQIADIQILEKKFQVAK